MLKNGLKFQFLNFTSFQSLLQHSGLFSRVSEQLHAYMGPESRMEALNLLMSSQLCDVVGSTGKKTKQITRIVKSFCNILKLFKNGNQSRRACRML
jgi:hypothetical protein